MVGIDLVFIPRIAALLKKGPFLQRYFTDSEIAYFQKSENPNVLAGNFAVKEAFSKALGTGIRGFSLKDVEVLRDDLGKPVIYLHGSLARRKFRFLECSISHDGDYATALVVMEEEL